MNKDRRLLRVVLIVQVIILISCTGPQVSEITKGHGITSENGMVVSAHPEASVIGVKVLREGGNATDAAVATGFALTVCYPNAGNIGGGGFMLIRNADGTTDAIDYRERAPGDADRDMYLDENGEVIKGLSTSTHLASGVPGSVAGLFEAHSKYGNLPFKDLVQPSIDLAAKGFPITKNQARSFNSIRNRLLERNSHTTAFVKEGEWEEGDTIKQAELALTLERIRDNGPDGFYKGLTADLIVKEMSRGKGLISHKDLEDYKAVWRESLITDYKGHKIISMPPVSSGGVAVLQLLGMVEDYPMKKWGMHSKESIHLMVEAERRVYADRAEYLGDPDFVDVPVDLITAKSYLLERMSTYMDNQSSDSKDISAGSIAPPESEETTHYSITDAEGNAVSVTTTLNGGFGNYIVVEGAGFFLNNEMDDFSSKPGVPNIYGLVGGEANAIQGGKRMLSSMTPTIVEKDGELYMVLGSPGGSTIITSVFQVLINTIDYEMDMQSAIDAPRFHHQWLPDQISFEADRFDTLLLKELELMGHSYKLRSPIGRVDGIRVLPGRLYEGGADRRGDDIAAGY
jgi:gamma-glutamyltranspeptidase/glutathione hydrolase